MSAIVKSLATPVVWVLLLLACSIWILRGARKQGKYKYGVEFFHRSGAKYIVVSGGAGPFGGETNAEVMKDLANGV